MHFKIATILYFGWLVLDIITRAFGYPIEGIYYSAGSRTLSPLNQANWSTHDFYRPIWILIISAVPWLIFIKYAGVNGARLVAFALSFILIGFVVVPLVTADMYNLSINYYWLFSMLYCAIVFFISLFSKVRLV